MEIGKKTYMLFIDDIIRIMHNCDVDVFHYSELNSTMKHTYRSIKYRIFLKNNMYIKIRTYAIARNIAVELIDIKAYKDIRFILIK